MNPNNFSSSAHTEFPGAELRLAPHQLTPEKKNMQKYWRKLLSTTGTKDKVMMFWLQNIFNQIGNANCFATQKLNLKDESMEVTVWRISLKVFSVPLFGWSGCTACAPRSLLCRRKSIVFRSVSAWSKYRCASPSPVLWTWTRSKINTYKWHVLSASINHTIGKINKLTF